MYPSLPPVVVLLFELGATGMLVTMSASPSSSLSKSANFVDAFKVPPAASDRV